MDKWVKKFEFLWQPGTYKSATSELYVAVAAGALALGFGGLAVYEARQAADLRQEMIAVRTEAGKLSSVLSDAKLKLKADASELGKWERMAQDLEYAWAGCREVQDSLHAEQLQLASSLDTERKARHEAELLRADAERKIRRQRMVAKAASGAIVPKN
jgi:hypothetical protein